VPPDAKLKSAEVTGPCSLRLTFKDPITANVGNPLGGVVFTGPGGPNPAPLNISAAGSDCIDLDTLGRQFNHVQMLGPVTNLFGESGFVATGYGMSVSNPGVVYVTSAQLSLVPDEIRFTFDSNINVMVPPHTGQARAPGAAWRALTIKTGTGADWQEFLWSWGAPLPTEWRINTCPSHWSFVNGYLEVPQSGSVLPVAGGLLARVEYEVPDKCFWYFVNEDLNAVAGLPVEMEVFVPGTGWLPAALVFDWNNDVIRMNHGIGGVAPTLWRLNAQPTGLTFVSGALALPQNGSIIPL